VGFSILVPVGTVLGENIKHGSQGVVFAVVGVLANNHSGMESKILY